MEGEAKEKKRGRGVRPRFDKIGYDGLKLAETPETATGAWFPVKRDLREMISGKVSWAYRKLRKRELLDPEKQRSYADLALEAYFLSCKIYGGGTGMPTARTLRTMLEISVKAYNIVFLVLQEIGAWREVEFAISSARIDRSVIIAGLVPSVKVSGKPSAPFRHRLPYVWFNMDFVPGDKRQKAMLKHELTALNRTLTIHRTSEGCIRDKAGVKTATLVPFADWHGAFRGRYGELERARGIKPLHTNVIFTEAYVRYFDGQDPVQAAGECHAKMVKLASVPKVWHKKSLPKPLRVSGEEFSALPEEAPAEGGSDGMTWVKVEPDTEERAGGFQVDIVDERGKQTHVTVVVSELGEDGRFRAVNTLKLNRHGFGGGGSLRFHLVLTAEILLGKHALAKLRLSQLPPGDDKADMHTLWTRVVARTAPAEREDLAAKVAAGEVEVPKDMVCLENVLEWSGMKLEGTFLGGGSTRREHGGSMASMERTGSGYARLASEILHIHREWMKTEFPMLEEDFRRFGEDVLRKFRAEGWAWNRISARIKPPIDGGAACGSNREENERKLARKIGFLLDQRETGGARVPVGPKKKPKAKGKRRKRAQPAPTGREDEFFARSR